VYYEMGYLATPFFALQIRRSQRLVKDCDTRNVKKNQELENRPVALLQPKDLRDRSTTCFHKYKWARLKMITGITKQENPGTSSNMICGR
ncbi:hypothetical protein ACJX0J_017849, partial [Zea mays]